MNTPKICPQCGTRFEGRPNKLFCSVPCKVAAFHGCHAHADSPASLVIPVVNTEALRQLQRQQAENQERQRQLEAEQPAQQLAHERQRSENSTTFQRIETLFALAKQNKPAEPVAEIKDLMTLPPLLSKPLLPMKVENEKTASDSTETVCEAEESGSGMQWLLGTVGVIWLVSKL